MKQIKQAVILIAIAWGLIFIFLFSIVAYSHKSINYTVRYFLSDLTREGAAENYPRFGVIIYGFACIMKLVLLLSIAVVIILCFALFTRVLTAFYQRNKVLFFKTTITGFFALIILVAFYLTERSLRLQGYAPGVLIANFKIVDTVYSINRIYCDSTGLNKYTSGWYEDRMVNRDGFLSDYNYDTATINRLRKGKKLVMIIGDSFAHGSVHPYDSCIVPVLQQLDHNLLCLNFGVIGTDPVNYRLIAEQYVPLLKPDAVVVAFCGANDFMPFDRIPTPHIPCFCVGNFNPTGVLMASQIPPNFGSKPNEVFPTLDSMYRFYYHRLYIPGLPNATKADKLFALTRVTSQLWWKNHPINFTFFEGIGAELKPLTVIDSLCQSNQCNFLIAFTPDKKNLLPTVTAYKSQYDTCFKHLAVKTYYPANFTASDYIADDMHWNYSGNRKFALFVDNLLMQQLK